MQFTIDTSVFISALSGTEEAHEVSRAFFQALVGKPVIVILPTLIYPEISGAVSRLSQNPALATDSLCALDLLPNLNIIPLDQHPISHGVGGQKIGYLSDHGGGHLSHAPHAGDFLLVFGCHGLHQQRIVHLPDDGEPRHGLLKVGEDGRIEDISFEGEGCTISQAALRKVSTRNAGRTGASAANNTRIAAQAPVISEAASNRQPCPRPSQATSSSTNRPA